MIHLHRAERADRLLDALAEVVAPGFEDPFTAEVVAVPTRGIERWLAQGLARRLATSPGRADGICANVDFPFPGTVVERALTAVTADEDTQVWRPERLVWPLLEVVQRDFGEDWLGPLRGHLEGSGEDAPLRRGRRFGALRHVADLYDRYGVHRPDMLVAWSQGRDVDAAGSPLGADVSWQAELWRRAAAAVGVAAPALRLDDAIAALHDPDLDVDLPERLSVFGLTALPATFLRVLAAVAARRDVHLFLLHPSPALWSAVADARAGDPATDGLPRREDDPSRRVARNPLLSSWGRDAREMQLVLAGTGQDHVEHRLPLDDRPPETLLGAVAADVRGNVARGAGAGGQPALHDLAPDDRSMQVHACHGATRQVEVLRDAILHLLAGDRSLEPRDIIVMCPDIEAYAPVLEAVFAHRDDGSTSGIPDLRVRLADRALRQTNPMLRLVADLLHLASGRLTTSDVLDLAGREPVRRRFRFDDDDLTRLERWVTEAQVRWGLDGDHRAAFDLAGISANTWRSGLDRILLGVVMPDEEQRVLGDTVPLDDVEGTDVDAAGRLAELVDRLADVVDDLRGPHPISRWRDVLDEAADVLADTGERQRWQRVQLSRVLEDVVREATMEGRVNEVPLALAEVRVLLEARLRGRPTRANHRTGDLTVCTLVPMRSVPHRVVCLLGMDDGAFPRRIIPDGDDLLERRPQVGDRDARTEDRQLLLDALLAARDAFVITYSAHDVRTNEPRPPAVPIGELLDVIDRTARTPDGRPAQRHVVTHHPLQPFDPRSFSADDPWSFDAVALEGARAGLEPDERAPLVAESLAPLDDDPVDLDDLVQFLCHPVRAFLRRRLDVSFRSAEEAPSEEMPIEVSGLDRWKVASALLAARLDGVETGRWIAAERARGTLPPGALATPVVDDVVTTVDALLWAAEREATAGGGELAAAAGARSVEVVLPSGRRLVGAVGGLRGRTLLSLTYSKVAAKHRLSTWVRWLALVAVAAEEPWRGVTIGRCPRGKKHPVTVACLEPFDDDPSTRRTRALTELDRLIDVYDRGMRAPLPLYCATSEAYAEAVLAGDSSAAAQEAARRVWVDDWRGEALDVEHLTLHGALAAFDDVLGGPPPPDEQGQGWPEEATRFGCYAVRLWAPVREHEVVEECGGDR